MQCTCTNADQTPGVLQGVPSGASKMVFEAMVRLVQTVERLTLSPNEPKRDSTRSTSPRSSIRCVQNDFRAYGTFSANREPILNQY
jgi:hypothetical protein